MKQKIKNTFRILPYCVILLGSMSFIACWISPSGIRYAVKGEHCKVTQTDEMICSFITNGFNVHIDAGGGKRNSLGVAITLDFFRADCEVKYNWESVTAEVDGFIIHPKSCYLDNIDLKSNPTVPLSTGRVVTLSIGYGKLPFDAPTIAKIDLGSIAIGDTASIDFGSVEIDLTKNVVIPGK
jgi:hypothetical protein